MNGTRGLVVAVLVAFLVGGSLGIVGGIVLARLAPPPPPPFARRGPEWPRAMPRGALLPMLERRLDLEPAQRARIEAIMDSSRYAYEAVRESTRAAIERELTPRQREQWRQLETRTMRERRGRGPRPPWRTDQP